MKILGIETSCDDTCVGIVEDGSIIHSNIRASQDQFHKKYSGVVPEIASRKHIEVIHQVIKMSLKQAKTQWVDIDAIAVTHKPGLKGSLLVGVHVASTLAWLKKKPLIAVDHLTAHLYSANMQIQLPYPLLGWIISGGHTLLVKADDPLKMDIIGSTIDDACGEAFDKVAKHFDLGYPGGPIIDQLAQSGNPYKVSYPIIFCGKEKSYQLSYSGLKTAVLYQTESLVKSSANLSIGEKLSLNDILASFQHAALTPIITKSLWAAEEYQINNILVSGGVAANTYFRKISEQVERLSFYFPSMDLCVDNGVMIAGLAYYMAKKNQYILPSKIIINPKPVRKKAG